MLAVVRDQTELDGVITLLEGNGFAATGTSLDAIAIDLASSTEFDALLISGGPSAAEQARLAAEVRRYQPDIIVVRPGSPLSILSLLRQEFKPHRTTS